MFMSLIGLECLQWLNLEIEFRESGYQSGVVTAVSDSRGNLTHFQRNQLERLALLTL
jgi:hypothetical protein